MRRDDRAGLAPDPQPQVERDLVVAAPPGVELGARRPGDLGDPAFDRGVDVLVGRHERERAGVQLGAHLVERVGDGEALLLGEQPDRRQHVDVRARPHEVVVREALIEGQADAQRHQRVGRTFPEPAVPERLGVPGRHRPTRDRDRGAAARPALRSRWRRDHVSTERPQSRTKPAASSCRNASSAS